MRPLVLSLLLLFVACDTVADPTTPDAQEAVACLTPDVAGGCVSSSFAITGDADADLPVVLRHLAEGFTCSPNAAGSAWSCRRCPKVPTVRGDGPRRG